MRMVTALAVLLQVPLLAGCSQERSLPTAPQAEPPSIQPSISDGGHGGNEHVYFLPPIVPEPDFDGTFDPSRSPTVTICELEGSGCGETIAEFTLETGPGSETVRVDTVAEHYVVNWHTNEFDFTTGTIYRIRILVEGQEVAHADVEPVSSGKEMKNSESGDIISLKDGKTLPIKFRIEEGLNVSGLAPAVTPDGVPESIYAAENRITNSPLMSGTYLRNVVLVVFEEGTSQTQRQAAIDSVQGAVVGGKRVFGDDGFYFVQIEDDGTAGPLIQAMNLLNTLPQVELAAPEFISTDYNLYLKPNDAVGFEESNWELLTDRASGSNWALERIASPLGWGCSVGAAETPIAVIDNGFHAVDDITSNLQAGLGLGAFSSSIDHGTVVAAVLGARGDNDTLIAGTMWQAGLNLIEYMVDGSGSITRDSQGTPEVRVTELADRFSRAAESGASVINMSFGLDTVNLVNPGPTAPKADSVEVERLASIYNLIVSRLDRRGFRPLFVVAAGNGGKGASAGTGIDARWTGFPIVRDSFPDRILVVAASEQAGSGDQLAAFSNRGSLVEIAAPGTDVGTIDGNGTLDSRSGTSVAAPLVSGVAGLLSSFDPRLSGPEIKDLILTGANRGGRTAGGFPLLNAYESLRAAAEDVGAPLCSNRTWFSEGVLQTDRKGQVESLTTISADAVGQVEVLHGGKHVRFLTLRSGEVQREAVKWDGSGGWVPADTAATSLSAPGGGTVASVFGVSHDADSMANFDASRIASTWYLTQDSETATVRVATEIGTVGDSVGAITVNDLTEPIQQTCLERDPNNTSTCFLSITESRAWFLRLGYPQFPTFASDERQAYVTTNPMRVVVVDSTDWSPCSFDSSHECRVVEARQFQLAAIVSRIDLNSGDVSPVDSLADTGIYWVGQGENGEEIVVGRGEWLITLQADAAHFRDTGSPFFNFQQSLIDCDIEYRDQATAAGPNASFFGGEDACFFSSVGSPSQGSGGGTIAPSMTPSFSLSGDGGSAEVVPFPMLEPTPSGPERITS